MSDSLDDLNSAAVSRGASPEHVEAQTLRIGTLVKRALEGTLPRDRAPRQNEPQMLNQLHMNMILDRAAGYTLTEIAQRWEYSSVQVANVLSHPDAQTILSSIHAMQANVLVSIEERFKALAPEALNVKVGIMRNEEAPATVRNAIASDILDRAGYAPRKQEEVLHKHQILMPAQAATGLSQVLAEANRVATVDYSAFLRRPGAEAESLQLVAGQPELVDGASPVPAPDASREFRDETPSREVA